MPAAAQPAQDRLDEAVARLTSGEGGPLPIEADGRVVAFLLTPQELERLEDASDLALLRAARAEDADGPRTSLEQVAANLGVTLRP